MASGKRRGPPTKEERRKNRLEELRELGQANILKGDQLAVKNYNKYLEVLHQVATGEKVGSISNQVSCAKVMKEHVEKVIAELDAKEQEQKGDVAPKEDEKEEAVITPLLSVNSFKQ